MSLITEVERILGNLAQEVENEASVLVQFAAGDWAALKAAFHAEKGTDAVLVPQTVDSTATVVNEPIVPQPDPAMPVLEAPAIPDDLQHTDSEVQLQSLGEDHAVTSNQPQ